MADEKSGSFVYRKPKSDEVQKKDDKPDKAASVPAGASRKAIEGRVIRGTKGCFGVHQLE